MITLGGQPVVDPNTLYEHAQRYGLRTDWVGKANGIRAIMGTKWAEGSFLMTRANLNLLDFNKVQQLVMFDPATNTRLVYNNLVIKECEAVTPSYPGDPAAVFHVIVHDVTYLWNFNAVGRAYNMRLTPTGNYAPATLYGGVSQFTWQQMWDDIWSTLPATYAGTSPTLPTLDGYPEAFNFYDAYSADALQMILDRIGCTLTFDPSGIVFRVAKLADSTKYAAFTQALAALQNYRLDDNEGLWSNIGRVPATVSVQFVQQPPVAYGSSPYVYLTVADPNPAVAGQTPGTTAWINDDLTADYQGGTLTNSAALTARANARAVDFFTAVRRSGPVNKKALYSGVWSSLQPGEWISEVCWFDRGAGLMTEVHLIPDNGLPMREWNPSKSQDWRETEVCKLTGGWNSGSGFAGWSGSGGGDLMDATVQYYDATTATWTDRFSCWVIDVNDNTKGFAAGSGTFGTAGNAPPSARLFCRFVGYGMGRPIYAAVIGLTANVSAVYSVACNSGGLSVTSANLSFVGGILRGST